MAGSSKFELHILANIDAITKMVEQGATNIDIAKKCGVGITTFRRYLTRGKDAYARAEAGEKISDKDEMYRTLWSAYARARKTPDTIVESALLLSCQDRTIPKTTIIKRYDPQGNLIYQEEKTELVPVAASVPAQQFYLANKKRRDWEYKPDAKQIETNAQEAVVIVAKEKVVKPNEQ